MRRRRTRPPRSGGILVGDLGARLRGRSRARNLDSPSRTQRHRRCRTCAASGSTGDRARRGGPIGAVCWNLARCAGIHAHRARRRASTRRVGRRCRRYPHAAFARNWTDELAPGGSVSVVRGRPGARGKTSPGADARCHQCRRLSDLSGHAGHTHAASRGVPTPYCPKYLIGQTIPNDHRVARTTTHTA